MYVHLALLREVFSMIQALSMPCCYTDNYRGGATASFEWCNIGLSIAGSGVSVMPFIIL